MKDIKIVFGKTGGNIIEDIKKIEILIQDKINEGYKIISSNLSTSNNYNLWIYAIMEKEMKE